MSDSNYITLPVTTDSSELSTEALQYLQTLVPGFIPNESNLEVAMTEAFSTMVSETRFTMTAVAAEVFRFAGKSLFNLPGIDGAPATAQSTWTVRDTAGYVIPANTVVVYQPTGSTSLYFRTQAEVVVPPGNNTTAAGEVVLVATEYGTLYNDLAPGTLSLVDALVFVISVVSTSSTSGGVDRETDDAYLNRLRADLRLLTPRPILPADFAALALNVAGVGRAIAIDNYNPVDNTFGNERTVAVAVAAADGRSVTSTVRANVDSYLQAMREVNFVVNVIDPTYTTLDVTASVKVLPGFIPASVVSACILAVQNYLAPQNWAWSTVVRYNELIALLSDVAGVDYVASLSQPSSDVVLPGAASLVSAGAVTITTV